jgi:hypothetical protein
MRIKNAFKILISNSSVIYKSTFFKLITCSIIALISYFVVAKDIGYLLHSEEVLNLWEAIRLTASKFFAGNGFDKELVPTAFDGVLAMLRLNALDIFIALLKICLFLFLLNLIERMANYAIGMLSNAYMTALTKYSMVAVLFANLGKAFLYSIIIVPIVMLFDGVVLVLGVLIAVYGLRLISIFAIILSIMFVIIALSCKYTLLTRFLPYAVSDELPIGKAFKSCFKKREGFLHMIGNYAFVIMITFYLNVSVAVFTMGVGLIITLPLTSVFITLVGFVDHYQLSSKRYYVSPEEVITPRQMQEHADLLKYM